MRRYLRRTSVHREDYCTKCIGPRVSKGDTSDLTVSPSLTRGSVHLSGLLRLDAPPVLLVERFRRRPHLIECIAVVKFAAFHHHTYRVRILDVCERIFIENDQVSELSDLKR